MIESGEPLFFTANRSNSKKSLSAVWAGNIGDAFVVGIIALLAFDVSAVPTVHSYPMKQAVKQSLRQRCILGFP
eukprot:m.215521 g.215521  ORF g.215521 m.215521 type:complete len:74 (-) comp19100_c0_seq1:1169-1390(-)